MALPCVAPPRWPRGMSRIVQYSKDIIEHVFYSCTQAFEIALRGTRQIVMTALYSVDANHRRGCPSLKPRRETQLHTAVLSDSESPICCEITSGGERSGRAFP